MDRTLKGLQILALALALLAPWIFFVGYSYEQAFLDAFRIDTHMFFKAPQEYFGSAYIVLFRALFDWLGFNWEDPIWFIYSFIFICALSFFAILYWARSRRWWARSYLVFSRFVERGNGRVTWSFLESVLGRAFMAWKSPILVISWLVIGLFALIIPFAIGVTSGRNDAGKIIDGWHKSPCSATNGMVNCAQVVESERVIASGVAVATSEKLVAIYNGKAVEIYSLNNRELRLYLEKPKGVK